MSIERSIQAFAGQPITKQILLSLLRDYSRPFDKISEMVSKGELTRLKRGLYITGPALNLASPESFLLANHLSGPSYVSLETALSYWQIIPEKVFEIASMTTGRTKTYETAAGRFSYTRLPLPYFSFGQRTVKLAENQFAVIASPEKALCDKIVATAGLLFRSTVQLKEWMLEDMRMERDRLTSLQVAAIRSWVKDSPKRQSITLLAKTLEGL